MAYNSILDPQTLSAAIRLLNTMQSYANTCPTMTARAEQQAYTDGMKMMLDHIISDYCTKPAGVFYNHDTRQYELYGL